MNRSIPAPRCATPFFALLAGACLSAGPTSASAQTAGPAYGIPASAGQPVVVSVAAPDTPPVTCSTLRLNPANGSANAFINSQVSVAYSSARAGACGDIVLKDAAGKTVATTQVYRSEWTSPLGGVAGSLTVEPLANLQAGATYQVAQGGTPLGSFSTAAKSLPRGEATQVTDQPVNFGGLPKLARIPVASINNLLLEYLGSVLHDPALAKTANALLAKELPHLAYPQARYNARVMKVSYTSSGAGGVPVVLSGLLVYPENPDGSAFDYSKAGMVLGEHGFTRSSKPAVSSASTADLIVGLLAAGKGNVFFAPDLIGLGDTATLPQSYLVTQDTGTASQDMLLAVRAYFNAKFPTTPLGRDLRIVGGSQGGFSSVAVMPFVSRLADIKGVYAGEGPYNLQQTLASSIQAMAGRPRDAYAKYEDLSFVPDYLQTLLDGYRAYQGFSFNQADIFSGKNLNPTFVQDFAAGKYPLMQMHMGLNSLVDNKVVYNAPAAKVVLFHYSRDSLVPARNTLDMLAFLNNGTHFLASASRGDCKERSLFTWLFVTFSHSKLKTHVVCSVYLLDRAVGEF
ncbi:hypothetical protein ACVW0Y_001439 [Pseudomonas sp. TE3786]